MGRVDGRLLALLLAVSAGVASGCGWEEPSGCEWWVGKLKRGEEVQVAIARVTEGACTDARPALAGLAADPHLGGDALAALIALGRTPESEDAVRKALARPGQAAAAAAQVEAWKLSAALPELRAALADETLAPQRGILLKAALAVTSPDALAGVLLELAAAPSADPATRELALDALTRVDWSAAQAEVGEAAKVLGALVLEDDASDAALRALVRLPDGTAPAASLTRGAEGGDPQALLLVWAMAPDVGRAAALAALARGPEPGWSTAATLAVGRAAEVLDGALAAEAPDPDRLWQLTLAAGRAAEPSLARAAESGTGDLRAAATRALVLVLDGEALTRWREAAEKHPSALVREVAARADVRAVEALTQACGADAACLAREVEAMAPGLVALGAELDGAEQTLAAARQTAEAAVAADRERAQVLAGSTGEAAASSEARKELEALRARRDEAWKAVEAAAAQVDSRRALLTRATVAARRLAEPTAGSADLAVEAATTLLRSARGEAAATLRRWALAVLSARATAEDAESIRRVAGTLSADPTLSFALARLAARLDARR